MTDKIVLPAPPTADHFTALVAGIVVLCALASFSVVALVVFHRDAVPGENLQIIQVMFGVIAPAITALLAIALQQVKTAVTEVHLATNSRLTELLEATREAARAEGASAAVSAWPAGGPPIGRTPAGGTDR